MNTRHDAIESYRKTFNVPLASGDYANERITFGAVGSGTKPMSYMGVTALIEGQATKDPSGAVVELWLPHVVDGTKSKDQFDDTDYHYAGQVLAPALASTSARTGEVLSNGAATWELAGVTGAQLRVKSGGFDGTLVVSAWAF